MSNQDGAWTGVDLDRTLAYYDSDTIRLGGRTAIGAPLWPMVFRVKQWLRDGRKVKVFTARLWDDPDGSVRQAIEDWCEEHVGERLEVTNVKDFMMVSLWDDRAIQVIPNVGEPRLPESAVQD